MRYATSYQTCGTPPSDPPEYRELVIDAIVDAVEDGIGNERHAILDALAADVPHLRIDGAMFDAELPNALRCLADRLDAERAKRGMEEQSRVQWESKGEVSAMSDFVSNPGWTVGASWNIKDGVATESISHGSLRVLDQDGTLAATVTANGIQCEPGWEAVARKTKLKGRRPR